MPIYGHFTNGIPGHDLTIAFPDVGSLLDYKHGIVTIKGTVAAINEGIAPEERKPHYIKWAGLVKRFREQWGDEFVPQDIKTSLNEVEEGVGLERTEWRL